MHPNLGPHYGTLSLSCVCRFPVLSQSETCCSFSYCKPHLLPAFELVQIKPRASAMDPDPWTPPKCKVTTSMERKKKRSWEEERRGTLGTVGFTNPEREEKKRESVKVRHTCQPPVNGVSSWLCVWLVPCWTFVQHEVIPVYPTLQPRLIENIVQRIWEMWVTWHDKENRGSLLF